MYLIWRIFSFTWLFTILIDVAIRIQNLEIFVKSLEIDSLEMATYQIGGLFIIRQGCEYIITMNTISSQYDVANCVDNYCKKGDKTFKNSNWNIFKVRLENNWNSKANDFSFWRNTTTFWNAICYSRSVLDINLTYWYDKRTFILTCGVGR